MQDLKVLEKSALAFKHYLIWGRAITFKNVEDSDIEYNIINPLYATSDFGRRGRLAGDIARQKGPSDTFCRRGYAWPSASRCAPGRRRALKPLLRKAFRVPAHVADADYSRRGAPSYTSPRIALGTH